MSIYKMSRKIWLGFFLSLFLFASCSESDDSVEEYAHWKSVNEKAFADTLAYARNQIALGDNSWKIIRNWSYTGQISNTGSELTYKDDDNIIVHVLQNGTGTKTANYTDSVCVDYRGRLLPSASYENGYVFDQTYKGSLDLSTAHPVTFAPGIQIDGFSTALLNMREGDRWMVYIPYKLGYGTTEQKSIPAYSMLRFDMHMSKIISYK